MINICWAIGSQTFIGTKQTQVERVRIENTKRRISLGHKEESLLNSQMENGSCASALMEKFLEYHIKETHSRING